MISLMMKLDEEFEDKKNLVNSKSSLLFYFLKQQFSSITLNLFKLFFYLFEVLQSLNKLLGLPKNVVLKYLQDFDISYLYPSLGPKL